MGEDLFTPTLIFYYGEHCAICDETVRLVYEIDVRTVINVIRIDTNNRTSPEWEWWYRFCKRAIGSTIVPVIVFWQRGFDRGTPHTVILEKKYSGVVTKGVKERVTYVSSQLLEQFRPYMFTERGL